MICIIALVVLGVLSIFSAKYRKPAKESFDCVFRRITFRTCKTNFDERIKGKITGKIMIKSPKIAGFIHKRFEVISWIFVIIFIVSLLYSGIGIYNLIVYNNCNGDDGGTCILTGTTQEIPCKSPACEVETCECLENCDCGPDKQCDST